jgi:hypothetical protein
MGNNQGNTKKNHQEGNKSSARHDTNSGGAPSTPQQAPHSDSQADDSSARSSSRDSDPKSASK